MRTAVVAVDVVAGDVLCPALDPSDPQRLTKATPAALAAGTTVVGVAAASATAQTSVTYFAASEVVPVATTGLGPGLPTAVVVDAAARPVRRTPLTADAWILGTCGAQGDLTLAPKHGFANVLDFGAKGDGATDDWAAITAAIDSLAPASGTGTVYFPPGFYLISRPLLVSGFPGIQLLGESRVSSVIRLYNGNHGPALCLCPAEVGHFPTGAALLTGPGGAGVLTRERSNTINFRDSPALDVDGLPAFSIECTVCVDAEPRGTMAVITSSGRRTARDRKFAAFGLYLVQTGTGALDVSATLHIGGKDVTVRQDEAVAVGVTIHLAVTYDGVRLRLFTGAPGTTTTMTETTDAQQVGGPLNQAIEEGVYLGMYSSADWPEFHPENKGFPGRIDSIRFSARATRTAPFTAPTAKFPTDDATNRDTLLLVNFDRDIDVFTVGYTWKGRGNSGPVLVYLLHHFDKIPAYTSPVVRRLGFQSFAGAGIHGQLALNAVLDRVAVSAARDGIRFRNNSYLAEFEHLDIAAQRLGLQLSGNTALVNVKRLQTHGTQYDFVATDAVGVFARDWYIGTQNSIVPVLLTSEASYGFFHGIGVAISSEDVPRSEPKDRKWQAAVMTASLTSLVLESSTLQTSGSDTTQCPCVIIDSSLNRAGGGPSESNYTFINCDFQPSPDARSVFVLSGENLPHPVRLIGSRKTKPEAAPAPIPWTLPQHAPLVTFVGGAVSTTDTGLTQWQGSRDWIFAYDPVTGGLQAAERESQATGSVTAGGAVEMSVVPLPTGATVLAVEVAVTDTQGRAALWSLRQGFTKTGTTSVTTWAPATRILDAFGSTAGAPPADWPAPVLAPSNGSALILWDAPAGLKAAFTVKVRTMEALMASA